MGPLPDKRDLEQRIVASGVVIQASSGIFLVMTSRGRRRHLPRTPRLTEQGRVRSPRDDQPDHNGNSAEHDKLTNRRRKRRARTKQRNLPRILRQQGNGPHALPECRQSVAEDPSPIDPTPHARSLELVLGSRALQLASTVK